MSIAAEFLAEFEREAVITRRFLERLPADKLAWRPHEKSMTAGQLALHIATVPGGVVSMAGADTVPPPNFGAPNPQPESVEQILKALEDSVAKVRQTLPTFTDDRMNATWRLVKDGRELMAMPRALVIRTIMLNHWIQHRGQFGVHLRLAGAKVPSSYGPSGDEPPDFLRRPSA